MPRLRPSRTQLSTVFVVLITAAMVWLAATKMDMSAAGSALSHASLFWVGMSVLSVGAAFMARSESWFVAVRTALGSDRISRPVVARSLMIGAATSAVTPARVGEAVRTWLLSRRTGGQCATVLGTVVAQTLMNCVALALLALFVVTCSSTFGVAPATIAAAVAVPLIILLALLAASRLLTSSCPNGEAGLDAGIARRIVCWFSRQLSGTGRGLSVFTKPAATLHSCGCQFGAWFLQGFACYSILMALGLHHSATTAAAVLLAVNLSAIIPITPANVGVFQAACIAVLTPLGVSAGHALAYGLLLQGVEISVALVMAVPALLTEGLSIREIGRAGRATGRGDLVATAQQQIIPG